MLAGVDLPIACLLALLRTAPAACLSNNTINVTFIHLSHVARHDVRACARCAARPAPDINAASNNAIITASRYEHFSDARATCYHMPTPITGLLLFLRIVMSVIPTTLPVTSPSYSPTVAPSPAIAAISRRDHSGIVTNVLSPSRYASSTSAALPFRHRLLLLSPFAPPRRSHMPRQFVARVTQRGARHSWR